MIAQNILSLRTRAGLTQEALGEALQRVSDAEAFLESYGRAVNASQVNANANEGD